MNSAVLYAFLVGALLPVQVGINATLRGVAGHSILAALVNFLVGTVCILAFIAVNRVPLPALGAWAGLPWWGWLGGVIGATYVAAAATLGPKLGATALVALVVAGQMAASMVLDQYGLIGFREHAINGPRVLGAALLVAGVVLIIRN